MNKQFLIRMGIIAVVSIIAFFTQKDKLSNAGGSNANTRVENHNSGGPKLKDDLKFDNSKGGNKLVMKNMAIKDGSRIAYRGDVDLAPTLARIEAGKKDKHGNDGSTFGNREKLLPLKDRGYYKEYVVRTPNIGHAGPQRLVIGRNGEVYYTHDHYKSFTRVQ